ncbi:MAG: DUF1801 domain-containing protein [Actinobacteria bacterium]|nr:DUF1801 domain-containing protein [Actinomycetota bacterium]
MSVEEVDRYLAALDEPKRVALDTLRRTILDIVPDAEQGMSYGVPAFRVDGKAVAGFSAAKSHLSYLPHSGAILPAMSPDQLEGFQASKGALKFPIDTAPSHALVARLINARLREIRS